MTPDRQPALEAEDLEVRFGERPILEGFRLQVGRGERVALTGPSGCGKSTVLRVVLGFVRPAAGAVRIMGQPLSGRSAWDLRRHLAYVAQEPDLGTGTAREVLERPFGFRANHGLQGNLARIPDLIEACRLSAERLDQPVGDLSGGEKQRIALVGALLLDRPILLLDEAASALDRETRRAVARLLTRDDSRTVLSVAHDGDDFGVCHRAVDLGGRS